MDSSDKDEDEEDGVRRKLRYSRWSVHSSGGVFASSLPQVLEADGTTEEYEDSDVEMEMEEMDSTVIISNAV
jgi:hypothetical protein